MNTVIRSQSLVSRGLVGLSLVASLHVTGCGVQGGTEGDGLDKCFYEGVPVADVDVATEGFDASPRALFAPAGGSFAGNVAGWDVALGVLPDFSSIEALHDTGGDPECTPRLEGIAELTLAFSRPGTPVLSLMRDAGLTLGRALELGAGLNVEIDAGSPLQPLVPAFSSPPADIPQLHVVFDDLGGNVIASEWRWSASVACAPGRQCGGGPVPGASGPTTGDEVDWGGAQLARQR